MTWKWEVYSAGDLGNDRNFANNYVFRRGDSSIYDVYGYEYDATVAAANKSHRLPRKIVDISDPDNLIVEDAPDDELFEYPASPNGATLNNETWRFFPIESQRKIVMTASYQTGNLDKFYAYLIDVSEKNAYRPTLERELKIPAVNLPTNLTYPAPSGSSAYPRNICLNAELDDGFLFSFWFGSGTSTHGAFDATGLGRFKLLENDLNYPVEE